MKRILIICSLIFNCLFAFTQSETHNFITYNSTWTSGSSTFYYRISRPANMFTVGNADTASRPVIITVPGYGEMGTSYGGYGDLSLYGPHYWLTHGWDGSVVLGNGTHYPILISMSNNQQDMRPGPVLSWLTMILDSFHIKRSSVYVAGLSGGAFLWGRFITYKPSGNEHGPMSLIKAVAELSGTGNAADVGQPSWGYGGFAEWARVYGGKYWGSQGTSDLRNCNIPRDTIKNAGYGGSAYFTFLGNGLETHCCWNTVYDPSITNWRDSAGAGAVGQYISTYTGKPNSMGSYKYPSNLFQWMLRQGDTTLVGQSTGNEAPTASAGTDQIITLPTSTTTLTGSGSDNDGTISSYLWSKVSGPSGGTISSSTSASTGITSLQEGVYIFRLTVTDNSGATGTDDIRVTVQAAANTPPTANAGIDQTILLPTNSVTLTSGSSDPDGSIASYLWTKVAGGAATITSSTSSSTTVTGLTEGIYQFRLLVTDNGGLTARDTMQVTVNPEVTGGERKCFVSIKADTASAYNNVAWSNWSPDSSLNNFPLTFNDGSLSPFKISLSGEMYVVDNGSSYGGNATWPAEVLRYGSYTTGNRVITITGLTNSRLYTLDVIASRNNSGSTFPSTWFSIGTDTIPIPAKNNKTLSAVFQNVSPTSGQIQLAVRCNPCNASNYVNALKLTEQSSAVNYPPTAFAGSNLIVSLPTNSAQLSGSGSDPEGGVLTYSWQQLSGPSSVTISNSAIANPTVSNLISGIYQFQLTVTDNVGANASDNVQISVSDPVSEDLQIFAGKDTSLPLTQPGGHDDTTRLTLKGTGSGTINSWSWSKLTGANDITIVGSTTQNPYTYGYSEGNYSFKVTGSNGVQSVSDTIIVRVVDWQKRGQSPCRVGSPQIWILPKNPNSNQVSELYLRRDGLDIQGGDTIKIRKPAPQWNGHYVGISLGDFGGSPGCPVIIVPEDTVIAVYNSPGVQSWIRFGNSPADTNFCSNIVFDGTYLRSRGGQYYGFKHNPTILDGGPGITGNDVSDLEIKGFYTENTNPGMFIKLISDSTKPWRIYNNFRQKNIIIHDCFFKNIGGEGIYLGDSYPSGVYPGYDGPTPRLDSVWVYNNCFDHCNWDFEQFSGTGYAVSDNNINIVGGIERRSGQRASLIYGGNVTGYIANNFFFNCSDGIQGNPYGKVDIYNNVLDSIAAGQNNTSGMYLGTTSCCGLQYEIAEPRDSLELRIHDNVFNRMDLYAVYATGNTGGINSAASGTRIRKGKIWNNSMIDPIKSLPNLIKTNVGDTVTDNTLYTNPFPTDAHFRDSVFWYGPRVSVTAGGTTIDTFTRGVSIVAFYKSQLTGVVNTAPTANAGTDITVNEPITDVSLSGSGSDADGTVASYGWTKISGPSTFTIVFPSQAGTAVTGLVNGTYIFRLTVTDNLGATTTDDVSVVVNALPTITINGNRDSTIVSPASSVVLVASATDADGSISTYSWTQPSGSAVTITNGTTATATISGITTGVIVLRCTVTDDRGASKSDDVTITRLASSLVPKKTATIKITVTHI